ncbi:MULTISPECIES: signal peptidase II [Legionella]|uniref:Lipoprotein signal peptidase n=1 Tax=Legionella septentrionalis TaxID=2498109 RepID=A0A433JKJ5_9GAMM|nr:MULTISPECIES: signal peptidase II [Legionella]MCP0914497.1 signal peptidase II [Legionella sp. 27cVA30]RUQ89442.1 lipoprotein signal peptidase [Legionella septentrionalis]RUQ95602.1 lipoprotein signal peptidase [Legionella septentrionalis]RUR10455.1 lipoprotein signal peptidase [Legionella septentrionalis]RUR16075.1 lipoprotein signal peptidase [Legionella septentrionalis]
MKKWMWFLISMLVVLLDQGSKYWATLNLFPYQPESILPVLNFTLAYNTGAAFSFLSSAGAWHHWLFAGFGILMSIVLVVWMLRSSRHDYLQLLALSLILGGALGNLVDRATWGYVIDFIDVFYKEYHWPIFNLADSAICIGAFLLFIDLYKSQSR